MIPFRMATALPLLIGFAAPALAQQAAAPTTAANQAADVREQPVTGALNTAVNNNLEAKQQIAAELQGQYEIDRLQYREAVKDRVAQIGADTARYLRQEEAYARAMIAWRMQVDACKRGKVKECNDPSPSPADFY